MLSHDEDNKKNKNLIKNLKINKWFKNENK